jgi:hypothetical protein
MRRSWRCRIRCPGAPVELESPLPVELRSFTEKLDRNEKRDMAKRFELIVFDWDGTLMDSTGAIVASIKAAATDLGIEPPSTSGRSHIIGLGLIDALRHALPDLPPSATRTSRCATASTTCRATMNCCCSTVPRR